MSELIGTTSAQSSSATHLGNPAQVGNAKEPTSKASSKTGATPNGRERRAFKLPSRAGGRTNNQSKAVKSDDNDSVPNRKSIPKEDSPMLTNTMKRFVSGNLTDAYLAKLQAVFPNFDFIRSQGTANAHPQEKAFRDTLRRWLYTQKARAELKIGNTPQLVVVAPCAEEIVSQRTAQKVQAVHYICPDGPSDDVFAKKKVEPIGVHHYGGDTFCRCYYETCVHMRDLPEFTILMFDVHFNVAPRTLVLPLFDRDVRCQSIVVAGRDYPLQQVTPHNGDLMFKVDVDGVGQHERQYYHPELYNTIRWEFGFVTHADLRWRNSIDGMSYHVVRLERVDTNAPAGRLARLHVEEYMKFSTVEFANYTLSSGSGVVRVAVQGGDVVWLPANQWREACANWRTAAAATMKTDVHKRSWSDRMKRFELDDDVLTFVRNASAAYKLTYELKHDQPFEYATGMTSLPNNFREAMKAPAVDERYSWYSWTNTRADRLLGGTIRTKCEDNMLTIGAFALGVTVLGLGKLRKRGFRPPAPMTLTATSRAVGQVVDGVAEIAGGAALTAIRKTAQATETLLTPWLDAFSFSRSCAHGDYGQQWADVGNFWTYSLVGAPVIEEGARHLAHKVGGPKALFGWSLAHALYESVEYGQTQMPEMVLFRVGVHTTLAGCHLLGKYGLPIAIGAHSAYNGWALSLAMEAVPELRELRATVPWYAALALLGGMVLVGAKWLGRHAPAPPLDPTYAVDTLGERLAIVPPLADKQARPYKFQRVCVFENYGDLEASIEPNLLKLLNNAPLHSEKYVYNVAPTAAFVHISFTNCEHNAYAAISTRWVGKALAMSENERRLLLNWWPDDQVPNVTAQKSPLFLPPADDPTDDPCEDLWRAAIAGPSFRHRLCASMRFTVDASILSVEEVRDHIVKTCSQAKFDRYFQEATENLPRDGFGRTALDLRNHDVFVKVEPTAFDRQVDKFVKPRLILNSSLCAKIEGARLFLTFDIHWKRSVNSSEEDYHEAKLIAQGLSTCEDGRLLHNMPAPAREVTLADAYLHGLNEDSLTVERGVAPFLLRQSGTKSGDPQTTQTNTNAVFMVLDAAFATYYAKLFNLWLMIFGLDPLRELCKKLAEVGRKRYDAGFAPQQLISGNQAHAGEYFHAQYEYAQFRVAEFNAIFREVLWPDSYQPVHTYDFTIFPFEADVSSMDTCNRSRWQHEFLLMVSAAGFASERETVTAIRQLDARRQVHEHDRHIVDYDTASPSRLSDHFAFLMSASVPKAVIGDDSMGFALLPAAHKGFLEASLDFASAAMQFDLVAKVHDPESFSPRLCAGPEVVSKRLVPVINNGEEAWFLAMKVGRIARLGYIPEKHIARWPDYIATKAKSYLDNNPMVRPIKALCDNVLEQMFARGAVIDETLLDDKSYAVYGIGDADITWSQSAVDEALMAAYGITESDWTALCDYLSQVQLPQVLSHPVLDAVVAMDYS